MIILLVFVLASAVSVALTKNLLAAATVFMGMSLALSVIWILLESPDLSVTEVALRTGFSSISTFNRTFKRKKNCTPREYRVMCRQTS